MTIRCIRTKSDVLVCACCALFLVSGLGAVGANGREKAKQAVCASQINLHLQALFAYGNEHEGNLPLPSTAGAWLRDVAVNTVHEMLDMGMARETFYCPSNVSHQKYPDLFWMYNNRSWDGRRFTNTNGFVVSGYCYILELRSGGRPRINLYPGEIPKRWVKTIYEEDPGSAELVIDTTMSYRYSPYPNGDFACIPGGIYTPQSQVYDTTNHLKSVDEPWGGNIGFLDGHVAWRPFKDMQERYGDAPGFWW
ncbi:MAG: hypothetical protein KBE04_04155 [Phycisphaerae bacterium]|nr:hypothetical protein [Phycisphaerae bacterium]